MGVTFTKFSETRYQGGQFEGHEQSRFNVQTSNSLQPETVKTKVAPVIMNVKCLMHSGVRGMPGRRRSYHFGGLPWIWMLHWPLPLILQTPCFLLRMFFFAKNVRCLLGAHSNAQKTSKKLWWVTRNLPCPTSLPALGWLRYSRMRCPIWMVGWYISVHQVVIQLHTHRKQVLQPTSFVYGEGQDWARVPNCV